VDVLAPPFAVVLICTVVVVKTLPVTTENVALTLPAGTVIVEGMDDIAELPVRIVTVSSVSLARG
jgi:hypothetical protein